ncbi:DUF917 domain-containing protein [Actinomadura kijaniata]|uniref:DUF917 domain-containing protein n=1 Tax=Actinomadura namibiensis TaxID=182080 RepID=A0A7W3LJ25_ACTNM|nr:MULTISPECIES: DUF917 domain-containing protein [Actinomadura]MBA8948968.1 hypothetical protein [Actinomadura namibiensis]
MREIKPEQLDDLARGAGILGTGGGGDPYVGKLLAQQAIRAHGPVTVVDIDEVPADAMVVAISGMGAPTVSLEKIPAGTEEVTALRALERALGRRATHLVPIEVGGLNSMVPFIAAAQTGLPVVDGDAMGRAFPEAQMVLPGLIGVTVAPMAVADDKGNTLVLDTVSNLWAERLARSACVEMGCSVSCADTVMRGDQLRDGLVPATLTLAEELGRAVREARAVHADPVAAAAGMLGGVRLLTGKVVDVERRTSGGFARGEARLAGTAGDTGRTLELSFQNEHLLARRDGTVIATTPDLICVLDTDTGDPVTTEGLRYGLRVTVLGVPCDPRWLTPGGLDLAGPRYFGYDTDHVPLPPH